MSTCFVLEGGAMRDNFVAGVLDCFMIERLPEADCVIGVSAGSLCAESYCSHQIGRTIRINTTYCNDWRYLSMRSYATTGDLYGADFVYNKVQNEYDPFDYDAFTRSKTKFFATCTNVENGKAEYLQVAELPRDVEFIRASASMPLVSRIVDVAGYHLLDGGVADSIPVRWALDQGYDHVVAVLCRDRLYHLSPEKTMPLIHRTYHEYPEFCNSIANRHLRYNACRDEIFEMEHQGRIKVITPRKPSEISLTERDPAKIVALYNEGLEVARTELDGIREYLES